MEQTATDVSSVLWLLSLIAVGFFLGQFVLIRKYKLNEVKQMNLILLGVSALLSFTLFFATSDNLATQKEESAAVTESYDETTEEETTEEETTEEETTTESTTEAPFKAEDYTTVDYNEWNHDKVDFFKKVQITGRVLDSRKASDGSYNLRVATSGDYDNPVLVSIDKEDYKDVIAEDDNVTLYGYNMGLTSYEAVSGAEITVPYMSATKYTINSYGQ